MNADQTIALVSVISGGAVGIVGLATAFTSGVMDRRHERELAREERRQVRLAEAYIQMLEMVEKVGHWAQNIRPVTDTDPPQPPPPLPDLDSQVGTWSRVNAYGTPNIKRMLEAWRKTVADVQRADKLVGMRQQASDTYANRPVKGSRQFMDFMTPWDELEDKLRPAEREARQRLVNWVAAELRT